MWYMWLLSAFSQTRPVIICGSLQLLLKPDPLLYVTAYSLFSNPISQYNMWLLSAFFQTRPVIIYGCLQPFLKPNQSFIICVQPFLKADGDQPYVAAYSLFTTRPIIICCCLQPFLKPDQSLYLAAYSLF